MFEISLKNNKINSCDKARIQLYLMLQNQYVNLIKGNISRSYSIANPSDHINQLELFFKNNLFSNIFIQTN